MKFLNSIGLIILMGSSAMAWGLGESHFSDPVAMEDPQNAEQIIFRARQLMQKLEDHADNLNDRQLSQISHALDRIHFALQGEEEPSR